VVAGLLLADRLVETDLSADALLELAAAMEGHGDNVAACLRGGLAVVYRTARGWSVETVAPNPGLRPVVLIPESEWVATDVARRALPSTVPLADAAFQVSRASLAVLAMTQRPHLLAAALEDRLHQGYRFPLMPFARAAFDELRRAGLPVCVAGSGPALLAFEQGDHRLPDLGPGWRLLRPRIAETGAAIREG